MAPLPLLVVGLAAAAPFAWRVPCAPPPTGLSEEGSAEVEQSDGRWRLTLELAGRRRVLVTETCADAARAAALLLRLSAGAAAEGPSVRKQEPTSTSPTVVSTSATAPADRTWHAVLSAGVGAAVAQEPSLSPRLALRAAFQRGALWLSVAAVLGVPGEYGGALGRYGLWPIAAAELGVCGVGALGVVSLGVCAETAPGVLALQGLGFEGARAATVATWRVGTSLLLWVALGERLALTVRAGPRLALVRPRVTFGSAVAFEPPPVSGEASVEGAWRW